MNLNQFKEACRNLDRQIALMGSAIRRFMFWLIVLIVVTAFCAGLMLGVILGSH